LREFRLDLKIDNYYDSIAQGYNDLHAAEQLEKVKIVYNLLATDPEFAFDSKILIIDVGCGTGISTSILPNPRIGLDPALELLRTANKIRKNKLDLIDHDQNDQNSTNNNKTNNDYSNHLGYIRGVAEAIPIKNNICNLVISITAVHNFDDIELSISEMKRIAIDRVVITVLKQSKNFEKIIKTIKNNFQIISSTENEFDNFFCLKPTSL
jgi:ubiquinone/menaquinone biosynthesis C-methylase UbiE